MEDPRPPTSFVVVVPAHNEVDALPSCLAALARARLTSPVPVTVVVALDRCTDGTAGVIGPTVRTVSPNVAGVGAARAAGFASVDASDHTWFVCTDADSEVDESHFVRLHCLATGFDAVLGGVRVRDWGRDDAALADRFASEYSAQIASGDHPVHGANLAVRAGAYREVGGFRTLGCHEDVDLVARLRARNYAVTSAPGFTVGTSARRTGRARGGFADHLRELDASA